MANDDLKITGNELDDDEPAENAAVADEDSQAMPVETKGNKSFFKQPAKVLPATFFLVVTVAVAVYAWWPCFEEAPRKATATGVIEPKDTSMTMDAFVIPCNKGDFSYVSFNVCFQVPNDQLRNEIISKMGLIRGKIYESFLAYLDSSNDIPSPESAKDLIAENVNSVLSQGAVSKIFLTEFIVI
jgi:flagellar basal body-associated protein FliL